MKKILIVEDDTILAQILQESFRSQKYEVLLAHDGEQGLLFLEQEHPDAVVVNIILPKIDGPDVLRTIKASEQFKETPVVVISNSGRPVNPETLKTEGAASFVSLRTFDVSPVVSAVANAV